MTVVTPGVDFLARQLTPLSIRYLGAFAIQYFAKKDFDADIPTWLIIVFTTLTIPATAIFRILRKEYTDKRQAAALGARLVPRAQGKYIGNYDILDVMYKNWKTGYPGDGLWELMEKWGDAFNLRIFWEDLLFTTNPEHIKLILATDFHNYEKGARFRKAMGSVLGSGVFNSDADMWKFHRSITRPVFTRDRISDFDLFDRHANEAISALKSRLRAGQPVDFQDLMSRFTIDSATEFLFGSCVHALSAGLPYPHNASSYVTTSDSNTLTPQARHANEFSKAFSAVQDAVAERERYGWTWPLAEIFGDKTKGFMKVVNAYIDPIVQEALEKKRLSGKKTGEVNDAANENEDVTLLDHLVKLTDDPVIIKDETLNIMIAGRDTTAATLTFVVYFLSQYPHVTKRLREEILENVGPNRRPSYEDIRELKYLRAVINETLRLYPIVPFNTRECINGAVWPSGDPNEKPLYIPPGSKVPYSVFVMQRRKDLWGPDAEEFDPDRFLDDRLKKYLVNHAFIFLPFNAGPRICLGQQFAYNEMSFILIRLLQNFASITLDLGAFPEGSHPPAEWSKEPGRKGVEKIHPKSHLTLYSVGGLWVRMEESEGEAD